MTSIPQRQGKQNTQAYDEFEYLDTRGRVIETERVPVVNTYRAGHNAGLHPEDQPYLTAPRPPTQYDDSLRPRSNAIRYTTTQGQQVIQQGNRRFVIHDEPPPEPKRRIHWLLILGIGMFLMVLLYAGLSALGTWWTNRQLDATYGFPRTWQTDQVVGHSDSTDHPSHFIFVNLNGHMMIFELAGGDPAHSHIYTGPTLLSDNAASIPITGEFKDVNGDGKIDLIVHIGDQRIIYLNDGTQFKLQQ